MALTTVQIVDRVISRLAESGVENPTVYGPEIEAWIPDALYRVALKNQTAREFQKRITGQSITAGELTITDSTLILESLPAGTVRVGTTPAFFAPDYNALRTTTPTSDAYWYTVEGSVLVFRNTDGTLGSASASSTVTLVGAAVPPLASLPARYEPALIEELVQIGVEAKRIQFPQKVEVG